MGKLEEISHSLQHGLRGGRALKESFAAAAAFFRLSDRDDARDNFFCRAVLPVVKVILSAKGEIDAGRLAVFRRILEDSHSETETAAVLAELKLVAPGNAATLAEALKTLPRSGRLEIFSFLLKLTAAVDAPPEPLQLLSELADHLEISSADFEEMKTREIDAERQRRRIISSGAGIAVALIVILVFILTATFLRSVVFGLIVAYLLLPVEKYFEVRLREKRGFGYHCFRLVTMPLRPFYLLSRKLMRRSTSEPLSPEEQNLRRERHLIAEATAQTASLALLLALAAVLLLSSLTGKYVKNIGATIKRGSEATMAAVGKRRPAATAPETVHPDSRPSVVRTQAPNRDGYEKFLGEIQDYLEKLRERFERLPLIQTGIDRIGALLKNEAAMSDLLTALLRRTGGIFSFTAGVIGTLAALAVDLMLTVFFALLFLMKLAEFCSTDKSVGRRSEYLVRTVFNGSWLPGASETAIAEARRIIGGIMERLRIWVKGYLTLVLIDSTVYSTLFYLLGVPYFPLLGFIAGCGILLPYIGPVLSAAVTILTTLAAGAGSGPQLFGIIVCYLVYNGIVEQFILYPAVIGESLGLTTLETIIVVLLGAIFAGVFGMIFALPAASVIKYLVPQIYRQIGSIRR